MSEVTIPDSQLRNIATQLRDVYNKAGEKKPKVGVIKKLLKKSDWEFYAHGAEATILSKKGNDNNSLVALHPKYPYDETYAIKLFHFHKIMYLLFPNNFPEMSKCFLFKNNGDLFLETIRDKVSGKHARLENGQDLNKKSLFPFDRVLEAVETVGLPVFFDQNPDNFILKKNDGVNYVDTIIFTDFNGQSDQETIEWVKKSYPEEIAKEIQTSINIIKHHSK